MGYYTHYSLKVERFSSPAESAATADDIKEAYAEVAECSGELIDADGGCVEGGKWYTHAEDVSGVSKKYPDLLFTLEGSGENNDDMWIKYFLDGKMQESRAEITFAPFSKSLLREV